MLERDIQEVLIDMKNQLKELDHYHFLGINLTQQQLQSPLFRTVIVTMAHHHIVTGKKFEQEVYDDAFPLVENLCTNTNYSDVVNSFCLHKSVADFKSMNMIEVIKEHIENKEIITQSTFIKIKEPWLFVHGEVDQEEIFQNMLKYTKPEKVAEQYDFGDGAQITQEKIDNLMFGTISSYAYETIIQNFFYLMMIDEFFEDIANNQEDIQKFFEKDLSDITMKISAGIIMTFRQSVKKSA